MKQHPVERLSRFYYHKSLYSLNARLSQTCTMGAIMWGGTFAEDLFARLQRLTSKRAHTHRVKAERELTR